jgi:hypothetical protein
VYQSMRPAVAWRFRSVIAAKRPNIPLPSSTQLCGSGTVRPGPSIIRDQVPGVDEETRHFISPRRGRSSILTRPRRRLSTLSSCNKNHLDLR